MAGKELTAGVIETDVIYGAMEALAAWVRLLDVCYQCDCLFTILMRSRHDQHAIGHAKMSPWIHLMTDLLEPFLRRSVKPAEAHPATWSWVLFDQSLFLYESKIRLYGIVSNASYQELHQVSRSRGKPRPSLRGRL